MTDSLRHGRQTVRTTQARLGSEYRTFDCADEAYVWLVECMLAQSQMSVERIFSSGRGRHIGGRGTTWIARSADALEESEGVRAGAPPRHVQLTNGWHLSLTASNELKKEILIALALAVDLDPVFRLGFDFEPA